MIKKALLTVGLLAGMTGLGHSYGIADFFVDGANAIKQRFVLLEEVTPAYFFDAENGRSMGAIVAPFYFIEKNGIITADTGYIHPIENSDGSPLLGASFHIDRFFATWKPELGTYLLSAAPPSTHAFLKRLQLGFGFSNDWDKKEIVYGVYSGISYKW